MRPARCISAPLRTATLVTGLAVTPLVASAQDDDQTERDRSFIVGFLEDNLSGAGRDIRIDGFEGLLSARATLDQMTISDAEGVWFTMRDAVLDWDRTALLRGRLEIDEITAAEIIVARLPDAGDAIDLPDPEVTPFALPELPVSIDIGRIAVERAALGASVLKIGEEVVITLEGTAQIADGAGSANLDISRVDGAEGQFVVDASYANDSRMLALDLSLEEGAGGIVSGLTNLPGSPPLRLSVAGEGPLDDFTADIGLATNGVERLTGQAQLSTPPASETDVTDIADSTEETADTDTPQARAFSVDLSGDLTPLFSDDYARFFGTSSRLVAHGLSHADGRFDLDDFTLETQALSLTGEVALASDGLPQSFALSGRIAPVDRLPVLLPISGPRAFLDGATLSARYDGLESESWQADISARGFSRDGTQVDRISLTGAGRIARGSATGVAGLAREVAGDVLLTVDGFASEIEGLTEALGTAFDAAMTFAWEDGTPLNLERFEVTTGATLFAASGALTGLDTGLAFNGGLILDTPSLSRFATLSGMDIKGETELSASGEVVPLSGAFDLFVEGTGSGIALGVDRLDTLFGGASRFEVSARRDTEGVTLEGIDLETSQLTASGSGRLSTEVGRLDLDARIADVARLGTGLSGPLTIDAVLDRQGADADWDTRADLVGPGGASLQVRGGMATDFTEAALSLTGDAPLGLANSFTRSALAQGTANFNLNLNGPLALDSLSGAVVLESGARVVLPSISETLTFSSARVDLSGSRASISASAEPRLGGQLGVSGALGLTGGFAADLTVTLDGIISEDPALYTTSLDGQLALNGSLTANPRLSGTIRLGETAVKLSPSALGAGGDVPEITHVGAPSDVQITRDRAGLLGSSTTSSGSGKVLLNLQVLAPDRIFIRGSGVDAELGGSLTLRGSTANLVPTGQFNLIRGRIALLGKRIDLDEGELALRGDLDPTFRLSGVSEANDITVRITTSGRISEPELLLTSSPSLPQEEILAQLLFGRALSEISALQAARMAAAVAQLAGGGGLSGSVREGFGLDDLDLSTTDDGETELKVGKYISDKLYTDVTVDSTGRSEINLNLDATDNVTVKGSVTSGGDTSIGVFFEKDY
ncbi:translocation/assembly module TamB domain-containing protein [Celeribacter sp.]|uniref:translocation/assembly module TamB domain-containing protein n=1 Tax=Celeribacter sp. TaxID=1890673 RepID=UPI003A92C8F2